MATIRLMTGNLDYDNVGAVPWSGLNHDVLLLVMMRLGVIDFVAFSGVCKSWRSIAVCNRKMFLASKPPMKMQICNEKECELRDFEGRKFKTMIPHSAGRKCVGVTCGYLVLIGKETNDFWLVNPITRHEFHFPNFHDDPIHLYLRTMATLVFSPSISGWLFILTKRFSTTVLFSIAGKGVWNEVSVTSFIFDVHVFKGKIYTLNIANIILDVTLLCEMRLGPEPSNPKPKLMVLETKNLPNIRCLQNFASYGETLYVVQCMSGDVYKVDKLDFGEMKESNDEKTKEEFAFYRDHMDDITAAKHESWAGTLKGEKFEVKGEHFWYFPHDCLNANPID